MKIRVVAAAVLMLVALPVHTQNRLRLPITIEVLRDVPAHKDDQPSQQRGVLYASTPKPFTIRKGQRFLMIKVYSEGECRIEFEKRQYDVASCPWLDGFADHQSDIFKVVR